jgi:hypothetical protein
MKKVVSSLALAAFVFVSHMSTVHAWDMFGMEMIHGHATESGKSLFCDDSPARSGESDCAEEPLPEKIATGSRLDEIPEPKTPFAKPFHIEALAKIQTRETASDLFAPPRRRPCRVAYEGNAYLGRIGTEVRKLD